MKLFLPILLALCCFRVNAQRKEVLKTVWQCRCAGAPDGVLETQTASYDIQVGWDSLTDAKWRLFDSTHSTYGPDIIVNGQHYPRVITSGWDWFKLGDIVTVKDGFIYHKDYTFKIYKK